ncbi:Pleckstrin y domain-containing A member 8 [Mactra antiquata]
MYMAGTLWKWTNYFSGWQERWFVLDNGILSYYKSEDDVNSGCKGSVKMSVCDISVHPTDATRLDLIIPGEQHFYVKAATAQERQEWLVALGSTKASMVKNTDEADSVTNDLLKTKRSELRLYCDLLVQQIHSIKTVAEKKHEIDIQKLDEVTSLLSPTCDTFIQTLEECMYLVQSTTTAMMYEVNRSPTLPITDATIPSSPLKLSLKKSRQLSRQNSNDLLSLHSHSRSPSISSIDTLNTSRQNSRIRSSTSEPSSLESPDQTVPNSSVINFLTNENSSINSLDRLGHVQSNPKEVKQTERLSEIRENDGTKSVDDASVLKTTNVSSYNGLQTETLTSRLSETSFKSSDDNDVFLDPIESRVPTFFSEMESSFMDLKINEDAGIPVEPFLDSCKNLLPIFDKLNSTAFAPVKMDFQGNIRKVRTKYSIHPEQFTTLQSIILHEISKRQQNLPSSATMALLWMKRSLEFISGFLEEIKKGEENLSSAATRAYTASLKPYHGWVVRGVFAVAVKALPYHHTFLSLMNPSEVDVDNQTFYSSLMLDIETFCSATGVVVKILNDFFMAHNLNIQEQI